MESNYSPEQALADAAAARSAAAARVATPWWYHPSLGLILAGLLVSLGHVLPRGLRFAITAIAGCALVLLVTTYQKRYKVWVGPRELGPRSWPLYLVFILGVIALFGVTLAVWLVPLPTWITWICAALIFILAVTTGPRLDARLRADISAGDAPVPQDIR